MVAFAAFAAVAGSGGCGAPAAAGRGDRGRGRSRRGGLLLLRRAATAAVRRRRHAPGSRSSATAGRAIRLVRDVLVAGWCALAGGRRVGLPYWVAAMVLFTVEWVWVRPDPGWGAWLAGGTLTWLGGLLMRHQLDLVAQLRAAQAGLAAKARARSATVSPATCTMSSRTR